MRLTVHFFYIQKLCVYAMYMIVNSFNFFFWEYAQGGQEKHLAIQVLKAELING